VESATTPYSPPRERNRNHRGTSGKARRVADFSWHASADWHRLPLLASRTVRTLNNGDPSAWLIRSQVYGRPDQCSSAFHWGRPAAPRLPRTRRHRGLHSRRGRRCSWHGLSRKDVGLMAGRWPDLVRVLDLVVEPTPRFFSARTFATDLFPGIDPIFLGRRSESFCTLFAPEIWRQRAGSLHRCAVREWGPR